MRVILEHLQSSKVRETDGGERELIDALEVFEVNVHLLADHQKTAA